MLFLRNFAFLATFFCFAFADSQVLELTEETFQDAVEKDNEYLLVKFYAPWCGHCKALAPVFDEVAAKLKEKNITNVRLAKINAEEHSSLSAQFEVKGFPTLKFFNGEMDEATEYTGGRTSDSMLKWISKRAGLPFETPADAETMEKLLAANPVTLVLFTTKKEGKELDSFTKLALESEDAQFVVVDNEDLLKKYEVSDKSVVLFKGFDEGRVNYEGRLSKSKLNKFLVQNMLPKVVEFNPETAAKLFTGNFPKQVILFGNMETNKDVLEAYTVVAKDEKFADLTFVTCDASKEENARVAEYFGVATDKLALRGAKFADNNVQKLKLDDLTFDEAGFRKFSEKYDELEVDYMSEEVPEDWMDKPVKVLVGKNFREVTGDENKSVFVKFYAPWCGHCKSLAPKWDELAEKFEGVDDVMIAKMDLTTNEVPNLNVTGFPTLIFFGKDGTQTTFDGERTVEALKEFVYKNAKLEVKDEEKSEDSKEEL